MANAGDIIRASDGATPWDDAGFTLASNWTQTDTFATRNMSIRIEGDVAVLTGTMLNRVTSGLAVVAGTGFDLITVDAEYAPPSLTYIENGGIGVAGNLGSCALWINSSGVIQAIPLVASGTISTAGGFGNSVSLPTMRWRISS